MADYSDDYHDYVFKNGELLGNFEGMYRHSAEVPWHQDRTAYLVFLDIDLAILRQYHYKSICEVGCGLGFFTDRLWRELRGPEEEVRVTGIDISPTAIDKAKIMFPHLHFAVGDLTGELPLLEERFDLVVIKEIMWYVCHKLPVFLHNIRR
jgi:SAM-dependent methyltransferase